MPEKHNEQLLRVQREANEKLVLNALRAHDAADDALGALLHSEQEAGTLRTSQAELRATAEFRERLIGIIGHDLRTPLTAMMMASELLLTGGALTENDTRLVLRMVKSGRRMTRMISELVAFARVRLGGGFDLTLAESDLGEVCRLVADELRLTTSAEIRQTVQGDVAGLWDADRLAEVLSNVAGNAVDHATPGTAVLIHAHDDGDAVVAEVTNQGLCIPAELLPVIFSAFGRAESLTPTANSSHLGLGLYISAEIVRAHGGTLEVRSADGTTVFMVRLPRVGAA